MNEQTICMACYLQIGDEVVFCKRGRETDVVLDGDQKNGANGVVIGFSRHIEAVGRNHLIKLAKPGIYESNGGPYVQWEDGRTSLHSAFELRFKDPDLLEDRKLVHRSYKGKNPFDVMVYMRALPSTPHWEGDYVRAPEIGFGDMLLMVININYLDMDKTTASGAPYPAYSLAPISSEPTAVAFTSADKIFPAKRGNFWHWEHDKSFLHFDTVFEEASFYTQLGHAKVVVNPKTGSELWRAEDMLAGLDSGEVDVFNRVFGHSRETDYTAMKFVDLPDLSARLQDAGRQIVKAIFDSRKEE